MKRLLVLLLICVMALSLTACSFSFGDPVDLDEPGDDADPGDVVDPGDDVEPGDDVDPADDVEPGDDVDPGDDGAYGTVVAGWSHFNFKPGQYFNYEVSSDRSGDGWVSVSVAQGDGGLDITCEGNWGLGDFADTVTLTKGMNGWDLAMELSMEGSNAMMSLLDISSIPFNELIWGAGDWEEGVEITYGDDSLAVTDSADYAGIHGFVMVYKGIHPFSGEDIQQTICVNLDVPLPLFLECPAANDTWRYTLTEAEGF